MQFPTPSNPSKLTIQQQRQENFRLQTRIYQYMQQIQRLKHVNKQHQSQIQSLLKFNERLLSIIQEQINNNPNSSLQGSKHILIPERSLHPISQCTEVDSEMMENMMLSLQRTKKILARSEIGQNNKLQVQTNEKPEFRNSGINPNNKKVFQSLHQVKNNIERSQRELKTQKEYSDFGNKSSFSKKKQQKANGHEDQDTAKQSSVNGLQRTLTDPQHILMKPYKRSANEQQAKRKNQQKYYKMSQQLTSTINQELSQFRSQSQMNNRFLDSKIQKLKILSNKINYNPQRKFNQLQEKIKLSPNMAALVKKAMLKGK